MCNKIQHSTVLSRWLWWTLNNAISTNVCLQKAFALDNYETTRCAADSPPVSPTSLHDHPRRHNLHMPSATTRSWIPPASSFVLVQASSTTTPKVECTQTQVRRPRSHERTRFGLRSISVGMVLTGCSINW
ncbi:hypothetical protein BU25DRAFT_197776 [Macroventuria anomochaeta]|uniref:Uncharacterized protein n=1 Tax=Macroventuria anomochaeta TaxID=301207 RepID=A0ACB6SEC6_9PLEO|nr:uncharacterized protein BU25DRAFT_197776 [Macroventuria anomochaeta]KAF2631842.1 hypothetical protein BU25DRAFT_197776 [Macroventuria anomochaeta]